MILSMEMAENQVYILGLLFLNIALCEWLVTRTFLKHFGTALLVIVFTAIEANLGIIPSSETGVELYDNIFQYIAPLAIFFLILECHIGAIKAAGMPLLLMFFIGSLGTVIGALIAGWLSGGSDNLGAFFPQIAGMFTGTYTGGSINFNAVALEYDLNKEGNLYAGAVAIDNIWTALWMVCTIALPKALSKLWPRAHSIDPKAGALSEKDKNDTEKINPAHISILMALGITALLLSDWLSAQMGIAGFPIASILLLTTISLLLAQLKIIRHLDGSRVLGVLGIYLFLAVIGAYCDFSTLPRMGDQAYHLLYFVGIVVLVHGLFIFGIGALLKQDWDIIALASQANVGGAGSALALARSLQRNDLLLPAILIGTLGNAIGTYLGFLVVAYYL